MSTSTHEADALAVTTKTESEKRWPIHAWLVLLIGAIVLPLLLFSSWLVWREYNHKREAILTTVQTSTRALSQAVNSELKARVAALETLALSGLVEQDGFAHLFEHSLSVALGELGGETISLMDRDGQILFNTGKALGSDLPRRNNLIAHNKVISTGKTWISDVSVGALTSQPSISINVPVLRDGRVEYVLATGLRPDFLSEILRHQELPEYWVAGIMDRSGVIVARSFRNDEVAGRQANPLYVAATKTAREGTTELVSREGEVVLATWTVSPLTGWAVAISFPKAGLTGALRQNLIIVLVVGLFALASGGAAALLLGRSIAKPLVNLSANAATLGRGLSTVSPKSRLREIFNVQESLVAASKHLTKRDADRDAFEARQRVLLAELDHRVKNTLATATAVIRNSVKDLKDRETTTNRIVALAKAHALIAESQWEGAPLRQIFRTALSAYHTATRVTLDGPDIYLKPKATQAMSLLSHELATNAAKHGALSSPNGRVLVSWSVSHDDQRNVVIGWTESGGPSVSLPEHTGFGSQLLSLMIAELGGDLQVSFPPEGFRAKIIVPLGWHEATGPSFQRRVVEERSHDVPEEIAGRRILVVEDVAILASEVAEELRRAKATVIGPAHTVNDALALSNEAIDAALLDVNVGGEMVFSVAEWLRNRGVPFVFLTGYSNSYAWPQEFEASPRISKPLQPAELLRTLGQVLQRSRRSSS